MTTERLFARCRPPVQFCSGGGTHTVVQQALRVVAGQPETAPVLHDVVVLLLDTVRGTLKLGWAVTRCSDAANGYSSKRYSRPAESRPRTLECSHLPGNGVVEMQAHIKQQWLFKAWHSSNTRNVIQEEHGCALHVHIGAAC